MEQPACHCPLLVARTTLALVIFATLLVTANVRAMLCGIPLQGRSVSGAPPEQGEYGGEYGKSHLLAIGIDKYRQGALPRLEFAVKDAEAVSELLQKRFGFLATNCRILENEKASLNSIRDSILDLTEAKRVGKDDRVIIYFAGHGATVKTPTGGVTGFLVPWDADVDPQNPTSYLRSAIPMQALWDWLAVCPAKHVLLIADACFSGYLQQRRGEGSLSQLAISSLMKRRARQVLTAGTKDETATELPELGHGVFTAKLLDELKARGGDGAAFTTSDLYSAVQRAVVNKTGGKQTPQFATVDGEGELIWTGPEAPTKPVPTPMPSGGIKPEPLPSSILPPSLQLFIDRGASLEPITAGQVAGSGAKQWQIRLAEAGKSAFTDYWGVVSGPSPEDAQRILKRFGDVADLFFLVGMPEDRAIPDSLSNLKNLAVAGPIGFTNTVADAYRAALTPGAEPALKPGVVDDIDAIVKLLREFDLEERSISIDLDAVWNDFQSWMKTKFETPQKMLKSKWFASHRKYVVEFLGLLLESLQNLATCEGGILASIKPSELAGLLTDERSVKAKRAIIEGERRLAAGGVDIEAAKKALRDLKSLP